MTSLKWLEIEPVEVEVGLLIPSQHHLAKTILPKNHSYCGDPFIHVVLFNGLFYISDGHNRCNTAKIKGERTIKARVIVKLGNEVFKLNKVA